MCTQLPDRGGGVVRMTDERRTNTCEKYSYTAVVSGYSSTTKQRTSYIQISSIYISTEQSTRRLTPAEGVLYSWEDYVFICRYGEPSEGSIIRLC